MYVELHSRSAFSFLEGGSLPEDLISACAQHEMPAIALLDRDGVYGAPRFHTAARKFGIRSHIGAEISIQETRLQTREPTWAPLPFNRGPIRCSLLVETREGYQNLCRMITQYKLREKTKNEARATFRDLEPFAKGLICLTGGEEGLLAAALKNGGYERAKSELKRLIDIFGCKNVYVEVQRHFERAEEARNQAAIRLAQDLSLPLLATNGVRYAQPADRQLLDVLTCIRHHCTLDIAGRLLEQNAERYLRSPKVMESLFSDLPEAVIQSQELSSRLDFDLSDLGYEFPKYPVPNGGTMMSLLRQLAVDGIFNRYLPKNDPALLQGARCQVERELALIERLHLEGYFLIVWDIVHFCNQRGILVQGRGSAANSAVCYALGITAVDPVGMKLLFERFLSEERGEWPDIDLDLPSGDDRERAIQYIYERYGRLGAAMTANVITYRSRSAAREVGKALGFNTETLNRLSSFMGSWEWKGATDTLENQFDQAGLEQDHPLIKKYLQLCLRLQDLPRHLGQHSGGMVICQGQLDSVVPLEPASMPGRVVVQWDKEDCADMGIVKVDLLGLGMMAVLKDCLTLIPKHYEDPIDLAQLPPDDPEVYQALQHADTVGLFQVESRAQMSALPRNRPTEFYDLVVQVAIIRPGPIVGKMMNPYMKRRQKHEEVRYAHPSLEPILKRTLGVPLFQEQLLRIAMVAANFTGGEAEELRRALGHKRSRERMQQIENKLRRGMTENEIDSAAQEEIITSIASFALYGFPESHAASFALIAYASAYLKCHYLAAFTAALLNNQPMGFYAPATIVKDAQLHGLKVKPVDVLHSEWLCTLEPQDENVTRSESPELSALPLQNEVSFLQKVSSSKSKPSSSTFVICRQKRDLSLRLGFRHVRGFKESTAPALIRERQARPFRSVEDLANRLAISKAELRMLAQIGALNSLGLGMHRRDALWKVERAIRAKGPLFESLVETETPSPLAQMSQEERLVSDYHGTGLTVGRHPMAYRRPELNSMEIKRACDLKLLPDGKFTKIAGCVIARQRPGTAKGFLFLSLEDETGIANAIITPDIYEQHRAVVIHEKFLLIEGRLQNQDNVISVKAHKIQPLSITAAETLSHDFH